MGKTTLVRRLCSILPLQPALEQHVERPFQQLFAGNLARYGLANQVDYLLLRGEQERTARASGGVAIQDGGLDLDYHGFARLFYHAGYLTEDEFGLCRRLYEMLRACLPPPDLIIYLTAPAWLAIQRYQARKRNLEITRLEDLALLGTLIEEWIAIVPQDRLLQVDAGAAGYGTTQSLDNVAKAIRDRLGI
jgi:deoxyadenosine/deoxycytidine kinase